jgi:hypothetical protein
VRHDSGPLDSIRRYDTGPLDLIFQLAGSRGGAAGRLRLWSTLVLVLMGMMAVGGAYMMLGNTPTSVTAAEIEDGRRVSVASWFTSRRNRSLYQISGHLLSADAVVIPWGASRHVCAPLVSDREGAPAKPRIYFEAREADYYRARAEGRFVGVIYRGFDSMTRTGFEAQGQSLPDDVYVLRNDGTQRAMFESGRTLLIIAVVVGAIALAAFLTSLRKQDREAAP